MKLPLRFRRTASLGALAALGLSGCHLFGSHHDSAPTRPSERPSIIEPAPRDVAPPKPVPYPQASPILPPAPTPGRAASTPNAEPQRLPIVPPPAIPPAVDEEPVPTAARSTIRPICFKYSSSCFTPVTSCCPTTCCDPCSSSLLSRLTAPWYSAKWRMECMKSSMKRRLSSFNLFNKYGCCAPVSSCCDPCGSYGYDGHVMDGAVVGGYSPYAMQPPVYGAPPVAYAAPQYQYPQPMMTQPPCATCQNQAAQSWNQYSPPVAPTYPQPNYAQPTYGPAQPAYGYPGYDQSPYGQQPMPGQNWQSQPGYPYSAPGGVTPQSALPQPVQPAPQQPAPATTRLQPIPTPAAQVSYLPGYSSAVPPVRQRYR